jgi:plasmid stabilization system protein ParE
MALEIRWTNRADIKLDQIIIYLQTEKGEGVVKAFMRKLYDILGILSELPEIGSMQ